MKRFFLGCFKAVVVSGFVVCGSALFAQAQELNQTDSQNELINRSDSNAYKLNINDRVRLTVFGEEDLSGEFDVDSNGYVSLPLIGRVFVAGFSIEESKKLIRDVFKNGYLVDPKVTLDVLSFQPFYILGEVKSPGSYPYVSGLTVLNAIALSGGYTYRADKDDIEIQREKNGQKEKFEAHEKTTVMPGDIITVDERFF